MSEPETKCLVDLIVSEKPSLVIHCHSWHPCIIGTGTVEPFARMLSESSGYKMVNESVSSTPGCLGDYCWLENNIPVICIEEENGMNLKKVWSHFKAGFETIFFGAE